ncbi:MAG: beta-ketoacyl-ACP synthase II [Eubacteriales bacterium]
MERVVITGLGIISPIGNDITSYWENLLNGTCGIAPITRFDTEKFKAKVAAEVKDFDPKQFDMDAHSIRRMDLYTQYAMAAAKQAMDDSEIKGTVGPDRFGVYVSSGIGGIQTLVTETKKLEERGPDRISPFFIPMMISNIAAGNIAMKYDAQGVCLPTVTACATSSNALGEAFKAIKHGYADAIIAGGSEAAIIPIAVAGFTSCQALSLSSDPLTASIPFDKRRKGFVMGEGAAVLVLEEYGHAKSRGAKIYAEICGYGNTCDAYHITAPRPDASCAARAIEIAVKEAGFESDDSIYINAHGTGTVMNDIVETKAIKLALGEELAQKSLISSTKSMTGHMLGAAGAAEAIATSLAILSGHIPPTIGLNEPDEECDLNYVPNKSVEAKITLGLSTSLGFGGHNACLAFRPVSLTR